MMHWLHVWHLRYQIRYLERDILFNELDLAALPKRLAESNSHLAHLRIQLALLKELYS